MLWALARLKDWFGEWTVFIAAGIALLVVAWQTGALMWAWIVVGALPVPIAFLLLAAIAWNTREIWRTHRRAH